MENFIIIGIRHRYVRLPEHTYLFTSTMEEWVRQWTTPNNTAICCATNRDEALALFKHQRFSLPAGLDPKLVFPSLVFTVRIVHCVDGYQHRDVLQDVYLTAPES